MNNKGRGEVNNEKIGKLSGHQINENLNFVINIRGQKIIRLQTCNI